MQRVLSTAIFTVALVMTTVMVPSSAEAFFRLGVEARWAPVAVERMTEQGEAVEARRELESTGIGARALFGFTHFSIGAKTNLTHHVFTDGELNYSQFDVNLHVRSGMPLTRLAFFGEVGPSMALDIGDVGFNASVGLEVDVLGWPLVDMNLGLAAQYSHVSIATGPSTDRINQGLRAILVLGIDIALVE